MKRAHDDDDDFDAAMRETAQPSPSDVARRVEAFVRARVLADEQRTFVESAAECTSCVVRTLDVRLYASGHVCIRSLCQLDHDVDDDADVTARTLSVLAQPSNVGGGVFYCAEHARVHVCVPRDGETTCELVQEAARGTRVCALSGRAFDAAPQAAYGDGNTMLSPELAHTLAADAESSRTTKRRRRRNVAAVHDLLEATKTPTASLSRSSTTKTPQAFSSYVDIDAPASDLFDDVDDRDLMFGCVELPLLYANAYAFVHLFLMSDERAALERAAHVRRETAARRAVVKYVRAQVRARAPIELLVVESFVTRALDGHRLPTTLCVPDGGRARLTAYWALLAIEFYVQAAAVAASMLAATGARTSRHARAAAAEYTTLPPAHVVPCVLRIARDGLLVDGRVVVARERLLALLPDTQIATRLGLVQKTVKNTHKTLMSLVIAALNVTRVPLHALQLTQLPPARVLYEREHSIVALFATARRLRVPSTS